MAYQVSERDTAQDGTRIGYRIHGGPRGWSKWWMGSRAGALREAARMEAAGEYWDQGTRYKRGA